MEPSPDELAGVADLFGTLSEAEFQRAFRDLAARQGTAFDETDLSDAIAAATSGYYLVELEREGSRHYAPGPAALPRLPEHGEDLPHMLDVEPRPIDREVVGRAVEERLRRDAAEAVAAADSARLRELLDVAYEMDAWGVDTAELRDRLTDALD